MNFFSIRTNDQNTIGQILQHTSPITFDTLSWHKNEISIGDIVFIVISGDNSKKLHTYSNGLVAISKVIDLPMDESDGKHFSLKVEIIKNLNKTFSKDDFYLYPSLKNAPNIGPETKSAPNQAFRKVDEEVSLNVARALFDLTKDEDIISLFNLQGNKKIDKLSTKIENHPESSSTMKYSNFDYRLFVSGLKEANLKFNDDLVLRFISSLISKPFIILTGLTGSGKSKLALSFANWICHKHTQNLMRLDRDEKISSDRVNYIVITSDINSVTLKEEVTETKVTLPYELIYEWVHYIEENNILKNTPSRDIRSQINNTTKYSTQLNSFESHLKAISFYLIERPKTPKEHSNQICFIPVGADWTNREPLLGYSNALEINSYVLPENGALKTILQAVKNPSQPYFLILDEMNLSHVERYFADFLSAMESSTAIPLHSGNGKWGEIPNKINLPNNLFIIGTVNVDETTYMFSPKVLDRANVIEFRISEEEMNMFLDNSALVNSNSLQAKGTGMATDFVNLANNRDLIPANKQEINNALNSFFKELKKARAEFGYRSASEIHRFAAVVNKIEPKWATNQIIDASIMQKLLPKIHGSRRKLEPILKALGALCLIDKDQIDKVLIKDAVDFSSIAIYPISFEKIHRMYNALIENGFTSFAEA